MDEEFGDVRWFIEWAQQKTGGLDLVPNLSPLFNPILAQERRLAIEQWSDAEERGSRFVRALDPGEIAAAPGQGREQFAASIKLVVRFRAQRESPRMNVTRNVTTAMP